MDCNLPFDAVITMKWRRGLVLDSIHFFIATSLIISEIVPRYSTEKLHSQKSHFALRLAAYQEDGGTVGKTDRGDGTRSASRNRGIASLCDLAPHRVHVVGMVRIAALENRLPLLETCDLNPKSP